MTVDLFLSYYYDTKVKVYNKSQHKQLSIIGKWVYQYYNRMSSLGDDFYFLTNIQ